MPSSREVWRPIRQPCQRATAASIASSSCSGPALASSLSDVVGEVAAVAGVEEVAHRLGRGLGLGGDHRARGVPALHRVGAAELHGAEEAPGLVAGRQDRRGHRRLRWHSLATTHARFRGQSKSHKWIISLLNRGRDAGHERARVRGPRRPLARGDPEGEDRRPAGAAPRRLDRRRRLRRPAGRRDRPVEAARPAPSGRAIVGDRRRS